MKKLLTGYTFVLFTFAFLFISCEKDLIDKQIGEIGFEDAVIVIDAQNYSREVIDPMLKPDGFNFYTEGLLQYSVDGEVVATFDFGDGVLDEFADIEKDGSTESFNLKHNKKPCSYDKVVVMPLIKVKGCDYIVEGVIKYYKNNKWVATVDFGDGTCDALATKSWDGGSEVFSLDFKKK